MVAVDIGGTFTDSVVLDESGRITTGKALSTPDDFAVGVIESIRDVAGGLALSDERELLARTRVFFHGCTVADNTLLTRSGPVTGVLATQGFGDTMLMMRGKLSRGLTESEAAHVSALQKPEPIVPRRLIAEVPERVDHRGAVIVPLDIEAASRAIGTLVKERGAESIAVSLLWSIRNDAHERQLAELVRERYPTVFVSLSSEIAPFLGEYERTVTVAFNAYIGPTISRYLTNLQRALSERGLAREMLVMQAYGGVLGVDASCKNAVGMIESAPAAGVSGCAFQGALIGKPNAIVTDMGGTTFKVGVVREGRLEREYNPVFARYDILSPKIWVESIGAGGGSVAWIDPLTRLLKVGPQGAGAQPGPVCYGLGGVEPTVSDADVVLGYLNPDYFLGGRIQLDRQAAVDAIDEYVARPMGMSVTEAASAIYRITNAHMSDLIHRATVERGYDPRSFVLFAVGGAAPVHASRYAADLGVREVVIPATSAVQGALGLISSDVVYEYGRSDHLAWPPDVERINANFAALAQRAEADVRAAGLQASPLTLQRSLDLRYRFQTHELNTPLAAGIEPVRVDDLPAMERAFDALYAETYGAGSGYSDAGMEIVTFRLRAQVALPRPQLQAQVRRERAAVRPHGTRQAYFQENGAYIETAIYREDELAPGSTVLGPAIIESPVTTIVINPGDTLTMDEFRNVRLLVGSRGAGK